MMLLRRRRCTLKRKEYVGDVALGTLPRSPQINCPQTETGMLRGPEAVTHD